MLKEYNIAGFGGQGILYLGQVLAYSGMLGGKDSTWIPSYGPEMRGGTANCMVVISSKPVRSPLVYNPDTAIILNQPSLEKYGSKIKPGGTLIVCELVNQEKPDQDLHVYRVPAKKMAEELGAPMSLNMVLLGSLVAVDTGLDFADIAEAIRQITPSHRAQLVDINIRAVQAGMDYMRRSDGFKARDREVSDLWVR